MESEERGNESNFNGIIDMGKRRPVYLSTYRIGITFLQGPNFVKLHRNFGQSAPEKLLNSCNY